MRNARSRLRRVRAFFFGNSIETILEQRLVLSHVSFHGVTATTGLEKNLPQWISQPPTNSSATSSPSSQPVAGSQQAHQGDVSDNSVIISSKDVGSSPGCLANAALSSLTFRQLPDLSSNSAPLDTSANYDTALPVRLSLEPTSKLSMKHGSNKSSSDSNSPSPDVAVGKIHTRSQVMRADIALPTSDPGAPSSPAASSASPIRSPQLDAPPSINIANQGQSLSIFGVPSDAVASAASHPGNTSQPLSGPGLPSAILRTGEFQTIALSVHNLSTGLPNSSLAVNWTSMIRQSIPLVQPGYNGNLLAPTQVNAAKPLAPRRDTPQFTTTDQTLESVAHSGDSLTGDSVQPEIELPGPLGTDQGLSNNPIDKASWNAALDHLLVGVDGLLDSIGERQQEAGYMPWIVGAFVGLAVSEVNRRNKRQPSFALAMVDGHVLESSFRRRA